MRPGIVDRPALVDALMANSHAPVVLVSAPAGHGKTTLLALWRERDERPFAWASLEAADNDPVAVVEGMLAALDPVLAPDATIGDELRVAAPPLEEVVLPSLVDVCVERAQPFVLVLDNVDLVTDRRCQTAIGHVAELLPVGCQLALATRTDPPLPLASWRAHGRLLEVRGVREGDTDAAMHHAQRAHEVAQLPRMRANLANVATYSVLAHLLTRQGDLEGAGLAVERAKRRCCLG